jgi:hypothetical protein
VLTAALALVALPGLAGSAAPSVVAPVPVGALQPLSVPASTSERASAVADLDRAYRSAGALGPDALLPEPDAMRVALPAGRPEARQPTPDSTSARKPPRFTLTGEATFYDHGTTAMRLPRGTVVVICGDGGCIERVVSDYGPQKPSRIVDLYRPDFFEICGCPSWSGVVDVTVYVY